MENPKEPILKVLEPEEVKNSPVISTPNTLNISIDNNPELKRQYIDLYIMRIVQGESLTKIAEKKGIDTDTIRNALKWCRKNSEVLIWIEALIDALNTEDFRMSKLVIAQNKLRTKKDEKELALGQVEQQLLQQDEQLVLGVNKIEVEKKIDSLKDVRNDLRREINNCHRLVLAYEDKIQDILDKKFNLQNLYHKQVELIPPENFQMNSITNFTANVKSITMTIEDRNAIADILERTYRRKV